MGVAALGGALVLGILTIERVTSAKPYCAADFSTCNQMQGITLLDQARGLQTGGFVLLGVGVAAAGTGVALFATSPRGKTEPEVTARLGPLGVTLDGAW